MAASAGIAGEAVLGGLSALGPAGAILGAVGMAIDGLVHLFHHKHEQGQQEINTATLATPGQSLVGKFSQAMPTEGVYRDSQNSVASF